MNVDVHAHFLPVTPEAKEVLNSLNLPSPNAFYKEDGVHVEYGGGRVLGPFFGGAVDPSERIIDMDRQGVSVQVLSYPPSHFYYDLDATRGSQAARGLNDALASFVATAPGRYRGLGNLPLQDPHAAVEEVHRIAAISGIVGVHLGTRMAGPSLCDPMYDAVWSSLEAQRLPIVIHPDPRASGAEMRQHRAANLIGNPSQTTAAALTLMVGGVMDRHPELRVCLVHGGGYLPYQIGRIQHAWRNGQIPDAVRGGTAPEELFRRFCFDSLTYDPAALRFLIEQVGVGQVLVGSDYPYAMSDPEPITRLQKALDRSSAERVADRNPFDFFSAHWAC